ncbi:hypothetical protein TUM19329_06680 [Legionella antarctica]|uniref:Uncharacterized protein n=1 Tax=Legionella antarctica TaxID=2708020 RepID=A0A6F8T2B1_9GAMM|nr:hypothetical protein TUM19329_06680 [Legionella antarctica]
MLNAPTTPMKEEQKAVLIPSSNDGILAVTLLLLKCNNATAILAKQPTIPIVVNISGPYETANRSNLNKKYIKQQMINPIHESSRGENCDNNEIIVRLGMVLSAASADSESIRSMKKTKILFIVWSQVLFTTTTSTTSNYLLF